MWLTEPAPDPDESPPPLFELLNVLDEVIASFGECPHVRWLDPGLLESPVHPVCLSIVWFICSARARVGERGGMMESSSRTSVYTTKANRRGKNILLAHVHEFYPNRSIQRLHRKHVVDDVIRVIEMENEKTLKG